MISGHPVANSSQVLFLTVLRMASHSNMLRGFTAETFNRPNTHRYRKLTWLVVKQKPTVVDSSSKSVDTFKKLLCTHMKVGCARR